MRETRRESDMRETLERHDIRETVMRDMRETHRDMTHKDLLPPS